MAWIPGGVLLAGTPLDKLPRVADEEMAGEQVVMRGFYVDVYPWPNEPGAIPTTNLSLEEARALCDKEGKRLCTELELERACKGPDNLTYEYGDAYKPAVCGTGTLRTLIPNGYNAACQSAFGVHDLHGGAWTWTASQWRRDPARSNLVTVRGGNGPVGELVGRCANGRGVRKPDVAPRGRGRALLPPGRAQHLRGRALRDPRRAAPLAARGGPDRAPARAARARRDHGRRARSARGGPLQDRAALDLAPPRQRGASSGSAAAARGHPGRRAARRCGVVIARMRFETAMSLAWVSSEWWQPTLAEADTARELYLAGGDRNGAFRRKVSYAWGRIAVGEKERKKKRKGLQGAVVLGAHSLHRGRVRHVGPPPPFTPTSPAGKVCTSQPSARSAASVTGFPSAITTTRGRTASTLQPRVGISAAGTGTTRTPSSPSSS